MKSTSAVDVSIQAVFPELRVSAAKAGWAMVIDVNTPEVVASSFFIMRFSSSSGNGVLMTTDQVYSIHLWCNKMDGMLVFFISIIDIKPFL